jgi:hypothetical protein
MQKRRMLSVKEAAAILGLDERSVRERLINGQLKGEKKQIGLREKWFVNGAAIDSIVSKQEIEDLYARDPIAKAEDAEFVDATLDTSPGSDETQTDRSEWYSDEVAKLELIAEKITRPLVEKVTALAEIVVEKNRLISEQSIKLKLLPDLEKQATEERQAAQLHALEAIALKKQIEALESEHKEKDAKLAKLLALEEQVSELSKQLQNTKSPWWKKMFGSGNAT